MNFITEKKVYTDYYAGTVDLITGVEDFESKIDFEEGLNYFMRFKKGFDCINKTLNLLIGVEKRD